MSSQLRRVEFATSQLLLDEPFYSALVMRLKLVECDPLAPRTSPLVTVQTFQTDGRELRFNPEYAASLGDRQLVTCQAHEVTHIIAGHFGRAPAACDWALWNVATDYEVNGILEEYNELARAKGQADPFPLPKGWMHDLRYKGQAAEAIYWELVRGKEEGQKAEDSKSQKSPPQPGQGKSQPDSQGQPQPGGASVPASQATNQSGDPSPASPPRTSSLSPPTSPGEIVPPADLDPAQQEELCRDWQQAVQQAAQAAQGRGHMPGHLRQMVEKFVHPKVPWMVHARDWLRQVVHEDYDWLQRSPRYEEFHMPRLHSHRTGKLVFAKDTSGSQIGAELQAAFHAEIQAALDELRPEELTVMCCDSRLRSQQAYQPGDTVENTYEGGGGTSFCPVFEEIATWAEPPVAVIYLTDLQGTFPDEVPDYRVLWVTFEQGTRSAPFGDVVRVD